MAERTDRAVRLGRFLGPYPFDTLQERGKGIHKTAHTRVYELVFDENSYIIKFYVKPGIRETLRRLERGSRARRNWFNHNKLWFRQVPVPKPVLYLEEPIFAPSGRSYVVSEKAEGYVPLDEFVNGAPRFTYLAALHNLAACVARMHRFFLCNRDLKAQNILVGPRQDVLLLDPDGIAYMKDPYSYTMARDLMRINASFPMNSRVSRTDRRRFLKAYALHMGLSAGGERELWWETLMLTWNKWIAWEKEARRRRKGLNKKLI
jgi:tRNA A-37 threonylcarbamoyl transferase component Bud32